MLRDGHFIREEPPRIGAHYVPRFYQRPPTPEERLAQDLVLDGKFQRPSPIVKLIGRLLSI